MADYISREAALEWFSAFAHMCEESIPTETVLEDLKGAIPDADVEPVRHGRWEGYTYGRFFGRDEFGEPIYRDGTVWHCSNPRCRRKTVVRENYCPSCGAKMDLEDEK